MNAFSEIYLRSTLGCSKLRVSALPFCHYTHRNIREVVAFFIQNYIFTIMVISYFLIAWSYEVLFSR
jgi:hypothetical protein